MKTVLNVSRNTKTINLPGDRSLYLPRRATAQLTEEEFACHEIRKLLKKGYLRQIGGEG